MSADINLKSTLGDDPMSSSEKCEHMNLVFTASEDEQILIDLLCRAVYEAQQAVQTDRLTA